jgi:NodT family efflux transporter outer membrane factor (OMF) lipoprotein
VKRRSSIIGLAAIRVPILAASLVAGGCAVGPDYKPPTPIAGAEVPLVSTSPAVETVAEPPDDWWHLYHDETLDGLLKEAFTANTDLRVAAANLTASRAVLSAVKAQRFPQTQADVAATYGRDPVTEEILELTGRDAESLWIYEGVLEVAYEVDLLGRVRRSVEAARADTAATIATRDVVKIAVAAETARAYAQVCALGEELNVAHHSLEVVSREAEITNNRLEAGAGAQFDVVRAEELVAQVRASIPPLEGQRRAVFFELAAVLGRPPSKAPTEVESCVLPPRLSDLMPVGDGASLLKRRPDVRQAERRLAGATARIGIATADLYPKIELKGFIGGVSTEPDQFVTNKGIAWGVGPAISWTFPNQAGPRARVRQAKAATVAALASFDAVVLQALKETEQALALYRAELDHRQALSEAQNRAQKAFEIAHSQFIAGAVSDLDLLTTEQQLISTDAAVAASDAALVQDQIAVFKALGGGWRNREASAKR